MMQLPPLSAPNGCSSSASNGSANASVSASSCCSSPSSSRCDSQKKPVNAALQLCSKCSNRRLLNVRALLSSSSREREKADKEHITPVATATFNANATSHLMTTPSSPPIDGNNLLNGTSQFIRYMLPIHHHFRQRDNTMGHVSTSTGRRDNPGTSEPRSPGRKANGTLEAPAASTSGGAPQRSKALGVLESLKKALPTYVPSRPQIPMPSVAVSNQKPRKKQILNNTELSKTTQQVHQPESSPSQTNESTLSPNSSTTDPHKDLDEIRSPEFVSPRAMTTHPKRNPRELSVASTGSKRPSGTIQHSTNAPDVAEHTTADEISFTVEPAISSTESTVSPKTTKAALPESLEGHTSGVSVLLTHDERFLASGSLDGNVIIWSRSSLQCVSTLGGHTDNVSCLEMSVQWLVSGSFDTTLRVYCCFTAFRLLFVLRGHQGHVTRVLFPEPLAHHVVSCSDDATLRVWNLDSGMCTLVLKGHTSRITSCVAYDAYSVCSGGADAIVGFWNLRTNQHGAQVMWVKDFHVHKSTIQSLTIKSEATQTLVFSGSNDGMIHLFNAKTLEHLQRFAVLDSAIYSLSISNSGSLICSTGDGKILMYRLSDSTTTGLQPSRSCSSRAAKSLSIATKWISHVQQRGELLACGSDDMLIAIDLSSFRVVLAAETTHGFVQCVRWLDDSTILTCGQDPVIKIWRLGDVA